MNVTPRINSNCNNNDNFDVSVTIPDVKLEPKIDISSTLELSDKPAIEHEMAKVFIPTDFASRKHQRQDEKGKNREDDNKENESEDTDEVDSHKDKPHFIQMDEEVSNNEIEIEDAEPKKVNSYAAKKTVAQGMMDIALITANANQLRYIVEFNRNSSTFFVIVTLIIFSLILQVAVGMALIFKGRLDIKGKSKDPDAKRINNYVVVSIFLVTIINVFIASFTITGGGARG